MSALGKGDNYPLNALLDTLQTLCAENSPTEPWPVTVISEARAAIGTFFLSSTQMSIQQVESTWRDVFSVILEVYQRTKSPEAAMLAQNFTGLILWRVSVRWDKTSWRDESIRLRKLVGEMTGEEPISWLSRNNLRISASFGPNVMGPLITDWFAEFEDTATSAVSYTPEFLLSDRERIPNVWNLTDSLAHKRFELIYDFPFVQEGIRLIARTVGWVVPFVILYRCTTNRAFTPLTRILFTIAFIDQYFRGKGASQHSVLKERFAEDCNALGSEELMSASQANLTKRTSYEVRASAAIAYGDPFIYGIQPGMVAERLRSGEDIIVSSTSLTEDSLAIHISAVLQLISSDGSDHSTSVIDEARTKLSESVRRAWDAIQYSSSPKQLLEALIDNGFVRQSCQAYESALKTYMAKNYRNSVETIFNDLQQVIGCVAVIGNIVFGLIESYGPGMNYLENYVDGSLPPESDSEFIFALGLEHGLISQILGRCIPPDTHDDYVKTTRSVLLAEMDLIARKMDVGGSARALSSARESLLLWFDHRAEVIWGLSLQENSNSTDSLRDTYESAHNNTPDLVDADNSEMDMVHIAINIRYPQSMPIMSQTTSTQFRKYIVATACMDALTSTTAASFSYEHIKTVISVLSWARDYGTPYINSFIDHRAKLNALISAISPFASETPPVPTTDDAYNIETLLTELHEVINAAVLLLPPETRPFVPPRPKISNSVLLVTMHGVAMRHSFHKLTARTYECVQYIAEKCHELLDLASKFKHFFSCRFVQSMPGGTVAVRSRGSTELTFGSWKIADIMAAIRDSYNSSNAMLADMRLKVVTFRTVMEETGKKLPLCDSLLEEASMFSDAAARFFSDLGADYAGLVRLQTSMDLHVRMLITCSHPPGMRSISHLLDKWSILSEINSSFRDKSSQDLVTAIENVGNVWQGILDDRVGSNGAEREIDDTDLDDVIQTILHDYSTVYEDEPTFVVELTARHNLLHRDEINFNTLDFDTLPPEDVDLAAFATDFITKPRVSADALVNIVDTVFNTGRSMQGTTS
uniref:UL37 n=1 Tax=Meleagrid herpesvirus 1 TaxID=37108 RepID=Q9E1F7_MEHV1|nr:UL37 [Meleagrid alphaherpesvirus 1]